MKFSELDTSTALKGVLEDEGVETTIYVNGQRPTSKLPSEFIEISENGPISSDSSKFGIYQQNLLLGIYVKMSSNDVRNTVKETAILDSFGELFKDPIVSDNYSFGINKNSLLSSSKNIITGYGTRFLNITTTIKT
jgi:hypothetical protein